MSEPTTRKSFQAILLILRFGALKTIHRDTAQLSSPHGTTSNAAGRTADGTKLLYHYPSTVACERKQRKSASPQSKHARCISSHTVATSRLRRVRFDSVSTATLPDVPEAAILAAPIRTSLLCLFEPFTSEIQSAFTARGFRPTF